MKTWKMDSTYDQVVSIANRRVFLVIPKYRDGWYKVAVGNYPFAKGLMQVVQKTKAKELWLLEENTLVSLFITLTQ